MSKLMCSSQLCREHPPLPLTKEQLKNISAMCLNDASDLKSGTQYKEVSQKVASMISISLRYDGSSVDSLCDAYRAI